MPLTKRRAADVLVFEASRLKAAFCAAGSAAMVYVSYASQNPVTTSGGSPVHPLAAWGFAVLFGSCLVAALLRLVFLPKLVVDQNGLRCEGGLRPVALSWNDVVRIDVLEIRGLAWLTVTGSAPRHGLFLQGWKLSAHEKKSRITQFRAGLGQAPSVNDCAAVIPNDESDERNRMRRQGMVTVVVAAVMAFLSFGDVRQVGVQQLPAGVDFQWAVAPNLWNMALAIVALAVSLVGFSRWFWPTGKRASPPLLTTATEWTVLSICMLALFCAAWMLFAGLAHPA